jgi:L-rhamnono-1,4-lactonase
MKLLDSHIHIWPQSQLDTLSWQTKDGPLYLQLSIDEYELAIKQGKRTDDDIVGFIFVEADRKFSLNPVSWTEPINEFKYALAIRRGEAAEGHTAENFMLLRGFVGWGPIPLGFYGMSQYVAQLRELCRSETELRGVLKGFRYLVQDKPLGTCTTDDFAEGVRWCGQNEYVFDLGVDFQNCGRPQLEEALKLVRKTPETVYILSTSNQVYALRVDHLAKPELKVKDTDGSFPEWVDLMRQFASFPNVYIKYSGLTSYLPNMRDSKALEDGLLSALPWVKKIVELFGTERMIWGSDWPVSNLNNVGLKDGNWGIWRNLSQRLLEQFELSDSEIEDIFHNNAVRVYKL